MSIFEKLLHKIAEGRKEHVAQRLDELAAERKAQVNENLDWRKSVVDLLKLAGEDSSFDARADLAEEFGMMEYGGTSDENQKLSQEFLRRL